MKNILNTAINGIREINGRSSKHGNFVNGEFEDFGISKSVLAKVQWESVSTGIIRLPLANEEREWFENGRNREIGSN